MEKIGSYEFPDTSRFKDALMIAREAVDQYAGTIPILDAVKKMGYTAPNASGIGGPTYRKINDMVMYGLFTRDVRGVLKVTPLGYDVLDTQDRRKSYEAKRKAILNIPLFQTAYLKWQGQIPDNKALPAEIERLANIDYNEAVKKAEKVKIALTEAFSILNSSSSDVGTTMPTPPVDRRDIMKPETTPSSAQQPYGYVPSPTIPSSATPTLQAINGIRDFSLTPDGIRIFLPRDNLKASWEKLKRIMEVVIEEDVEVKKPKKEPKASSPQTQGSDSQTQK